MGCGHPAEWHTPGKKSARSSCPWVVSEHNKRTAFAVLFVMLVETTSHSPDGESVLQRGRGSFGVRRRQAAELARTGHMTRLICAGTEMRTHHAFMGRFAREVRDFELSPSKAKKDGVYRPFFALLVETTRLELVTSTMST